MSIPWECAVPTVLTLPPPLLCNSDHGLAWLPLLLLLHLLLLIQAPPPAIAQSENTQPPSLPDRFSSLRFDKSMAIVLVILVVVFFILGFLSVYTRQCAERRIMGRLNLPIPIIGSERRPRGLAPEIIDTFPTFFYSAVKGLKIGRATLECAVCLNEFQDDETLRLIPQCCHVFHPHCIDVWLATHSTCPVCRANLAPRPGDMSFVAVQIPDPAGVGSNQPDPGTDSGHQLHHNNGQVGDIDDHHNRAAESPKVDSVNQNRPPRSRSTGFGIASLFPRSHSTGHDSLVQPGENRERFTLRLPAEVRNQLVSSTLHRANSCGETFTRESSGRRGYRTRSMGSARGRSHLQSERFGSEARPDRWGFTWTPPFVSRTGSTKLTKGLTESNKASVATERDNVGERSSDRLFAGSEEN